MGVGRSTRSERPEAKAGVEERVGKLKELHV
jgi:hypothetical protein